MHLVLRLRIGMQIFIVWALTGEVVEENIGRYEPVWDFRRAVARSTGVPPSQQRLIFNGRVHDYWTVADYGITYGSRILLVVVA